MIRILKYTGDISEEEWNCVSTIIFLKTDSPRDGMPQANTDNKKNCFDDKDKARLLVYLKPTYSTINLPTHPGCFCIITANAVICSKIMKSIMEVWLATKTCSVKENADY